MSEGRDEDVGVRRNEVIALVAVIDEGSILSADYRVEDGAMRGRRREIAVALRVVAALIEGAGASA